MSALHLNEESVATILEIHSQVYLEIQDDEAFPEDFTYVDQLLELSHSQNVIRNITLFCHTLVLNGRTHDDDFLSYLKPFYCFIEPFIRLLHHFEYDYAKMVKNISQCVHEGNPIESISSGIKELILTVFPDGELILGIVQELSLLKMGNQTQFVSSLYKSICEKTNLTRETDEQAYFMTIGKAALISNLLTLNNWEAFSSAFIRMQSFYSK